MTAPSTTVSLFLATLLWAPSLKAAGPEARGQTPSETKQELIKEASRQAQEIDALYDRLKSLAAAHRSGQPSGVSPEQREELRQRTEQAAWQLEELMKRYWAADASNRAFQGARIIGKYGKKDAKPVDIATVISAFSIDEFPNEMEDAIGRAHNVLSHEYAAYEAAQRRRAKFQFALHVPAGRP